MSWEPLIALAACLIVPGVWGWLIHLLFRRWVGTAGLGGAPPEESGSVEWDYQI